jgi:putative transposase
MGKREIPLPNEFYHTFNRGVEKRKVFCDEEDFFRAVHDLYEFNDLDAVINLKYRADRIKIYGDPTSIYGKKKRKLLIDLFGWALIFNHYHLFSRPKIPEGLSKFHQKFGSGYTGYFNLKYRRNGVLFQGKYKIVHVENDAQAAHLICYIHANPLDLWKPNWKEKGLRALELKEALKFLENYRWSSHLDYLGRKNFPSLINKEFLEKFFGGPKGYSEFFSDWLKQYQANIKSIQPLILE